MFVIEKCRKNLKSCISAWTQNSGKKFNFCGNRKFLFDFIRRHLTQF